MVRMRWFVWAPESYAHSAHDSMPRQKAPRWHPSDRARSEIAQGSRALCGVGVWGSDRWLGLFRLAPGLNEAIPIEIKRPEHLVATGTIIWHAYISHNAIHLFQLSAAIHVIHRALPALAPTLTALRSRVRDGACQRNAGLTAQDSGCPGPYLRHPPHLSGVDPTRWRTGALVFFGAAPGVAPTEAKAVIYQDWSLAL